MINVAFLGKAVKGDGKYSNNYNTNFVRKNCQRLLDANTCLGTYFCKGVDTYGPFKLIGGIAKGHSNDEEIQKAVEFYQSL